MTKNTLWILFYLTLYMFIHARILRWHHILCSKFSIFGEKWHNRTSQSSFDGEWHNIQYFVQSKSSASQISRAASFVHFVILVLLLCFWNHETPCSTLNCVVNSAIFPKGFALYLEDENEDKLSTPISDFLHLTSYSNQPSPSPA